MRGQDDGQEPVIALHVVVDVAQVVRDVAEQVAQVDVQVPAHVSAASQLDRSPVISMALTPPL